MPIITLTLLMGAGHILLAKLSAGAAYYAAHGAAGAVHGALAGATQAVSTHGIANAGNLVAQKICESAGTSVAQAVLAAHPATPYYVLGAVGAAGAAAAVAG